MKLTGKKALILGLANKHSIAYAIAKELAASGVELVISYASAALAKRVLPIADELGVTDCIQCDLSKDYEIQNLIRLVSSKYHSLDYVVHSVAYAPSSELNIPFHHTSRHGFLTAMDINV